jgi:hypothetical protein
MTIFKASVAALAFVITGAVSTFAQDRAPALIVEKGIGRVAVDGIQMSFVMGEAYDPNNEYPDDEPNFTSVRKITVHDDRGTFLAGVETLEKWCRSEPEAIDPMNINLEQFKKLKAEWLKNPKALA